LERLIIAILVAVFSAMFNKRGNQSQKKAPIYPKTRSKKDIYKRNADIEMAEQKPKKATKKAYEVQYSSDHETRNNNYEIKYDYTDKTADENQYKDMQIEESDTESGEIFDVGLSDLQRAIVMSEILSKPLALRKK